MGCGNSNLPADLARQGFSVVGMDYSKSHGRLALVCFSLVLFFPHGQGSVLLDLHTFACFALGF